MLIECYTMEDDSVSKSAAPVALLTVTDGNASPNDTEDDVDLLDDCGVRLNDSQILANLKAKLGHLNHSQIIAELKAVTQAGPAHCFKKVAKCSTELVACKSMLF